MAQILARDVQLHADRDVVMAGSSEVAARDHLNIGSQRGIRITDSSQLRRLSVTDPLKLHLDARGGDLAITDSTVDASDIFIESEAGNLSLVYGTITGDFIRARSLGLAGELLLGGNSSLTATNAIRLYSEGSSGHVRITGPVSLSSPSTTVAGKTVTVDAGVSVNVVTPGGFRVYTDNAQFSNNGGPAGYCDFRNGGAPFPVNQQPFANRTGF